MGLEPPQTTGERRGLSGLITRANKQHADPSDVALIHLWLRIEQKHKNNLRLKTGHFCTFDVSVLDPALFI